MNQEANSGNLPEQQGKSATYKRGNRKGNNRPTLVSPTTEAANSEQEQSYAENGLSSGSDVTTPSTTATIAALPVTPAKNRPRFFSTIGRKEALTQETVADPAAARLSRATRGKAVATGKIQESKKSDTKAVAPATATPARAAAARPARPPSAFKPRHFIGILIYIIVADVVGIYEKNLLVSAKLEKLLFNLGPLPVYLSTVLFLLTLVVMLVVLARFDLVPRSLTGASRPVNKGTTTRTSGGDDASTKAPPTYKQGVKGTDDNLYQEYRQNQRYWQRRDRKK